MALMRPKVGKRPIFGRHKPPYDFIKPAPTILGVNNDGAKRGTKYPISDFSDTPRVTAG